MSVAEHMLRGFGAHPKDVQRAQFSISATTADAVAAPGAGKRLLILEVFSQNNGTGSEAWLDGATAITGTMTTNVAHNKSMGPWLLSENVALRLTATTIACSGYVTYVVVDA